LRIPKKKELLELQRKYRTDKKIGEVYGVPARLVAYWRAKKKIGAYSFPKYSEEKIQELWDRYGDDAKAGVELNISRAGFRQWRRRYDVNQKPLQLKLEQLELALPDTGRRKASRKETIVQKILARKSGLKKVEVGDVVYIEPDLAVSHGNAGWVIHFFDLLGAAKVWEPGKIVVVLDRIGAEDDHFPSHRAVREFIKKQRIRNFYDIGSGICYQVVLENSHVLPGQVALGVDSQAINFGAIGALGASLGYEEMAAAWATGRVWLKVPEATRVVINGRTATGVSAKDVALVLRHDLSPGNTTYRAIEIHGPAAASMPISDRLTITNCISSSGCKAVIVPFDDVAARFLRRTIKARFAPLAADTDAAYADEVELDISYLTPQVAHNNDFESVQPVEEVSGRRIDQVILGCCANGRIEDFEVMARILRGRHISREVRTMVVPGSRKVLSEALDRGFIRTLIDSGCIIMSPGCSSCAEAHSKFIESGERALTTGNPNCTEDLVAAPREIYMASPATAAATALEGVIADPRKYVK